MATVRSRRRPVRAVEQVHKSVPATSSLVRLATCPAARTAYVLIGTAGLVALAVATVGPRRL